ncbi:peptidase inhibitor family I36 protein [Nocardia sp. CDC159]|uniref:Peptidase inhibitor family I36 protein n=1 Tax=Nocardia pulmonis TaxID=2951408 RepID=A0A9X2E3U8_9NOCA|nr:MULTISPECIES: peptidase inhibitor family I36 protein [Nocardia]MCM6773612.1 peptidase inhibitor family I36 protein [Nocardia pulmonis]MCM6786499.1 peptidase inhibitor family I36 protein [Nocardia sp. CDC159]
MQKMIVVAAAMFVGVGLVPSVAQADDGGRVAAQPTGTPEVLADGRLSWHNGDVQLVPETAAAWSCDNGYLCLYDNRGGEGRRLQFRDHYCQNLSDYNFNDKAESYWNRNNSGFFWYEHTGCRQPRKWISAGARNGDMGGDRNKMSSIG